MSRAHEESYRYFEELRERTREEVQHGNLDAALELCDEAIAWAERFSDKDACDLAHCNRSSILVHQGHGADVISKLRQILLGSSNPEICHHAAYNISRFHEMRQEPERGLFYARLSVDHAKKSGKPEPMARSNNQLGLLLVRDSYFEEAQDCFSRALSRLPSKISHDATVILYNLGYCHTMLGHSRRGFSHLFSSLRSARRQQAEVWELYPRLGLSFAYLEIERPERSRHHARRGLQLAESAEIHWQVKNALYLLGESEKLLGNELTAHCQFTRLQQEFYPDDPVIPDFLMATDVRKLINLMA